MMKRPLTLFAVFLILRIFSTFPLWAQSEPRSIHQQEWEYYRQFKTDKTGETAGEKILPINRTAAANRYLSKTVFGYLPYWKRSSAPPYLQYHLLSHIAIFDWGTSPTGILSNPSGWPGDWSSMINKAHRYGVKVIMCVVEFDDDDMHTLLNNNSNRLTFIENVIDEIRDYNLDGVNIDFEGPKYDDRAAVMNRFMSQLTDSVHKQLGSDYEVSFAGPAINWGDRWDLAGLANACDYIFIMGYAFWGSWSATAGPTAPLEGLTNSVTSSVLTEYGDVTRSTPQKLILGVPYYGNRWETQGSSEGSSAIDYIGSVYYATGADLFRSEGREWSSTYKVPWTAYTSNGQWVQAWCDDDESLDLKYKLVTDNDLLGSGMWALGYDDDEMDLWNLLAQRYYQFPDQYSIAGFEDSLGGFNVHPTYSGSTHGISTASSQDIDPDEGYTGNSSMQLIIMDDSSTTDDWTIRVLANKGNKFLNRGLHPNGIIRLYLKTSGSSDKEIALSIDDMAGGTEISERLPIIADNDWHEYTWDFSDQDSWQSFYMGNGRVDGPIVSLDAILLYSPDQTDNWTLNIDDVEYESIPSGLVTPGAASFSLKANYPNPFNAQTTIEYSIVRAGDVSLKIYDIRGHLMEEVVRRYHSPGDYRFHFSADHYPSGVYLYQLSLNGTLKTGKMTILK